MVANELEVPPRSEALRNMVLASKMARSLGFMVRTAKSKPWTDFWGGGPERRDGQRSEERHRFDRHSSIFNGGWSH